MKWTKDDEQTLAKLYLINRKSTPDIAAIMNRDKGAVRAKITKLGLCSTSAKQHYNHGILSTTTDAITASGT